MFLKMYNLVLGKQNSFSKKIKLLEVIVAFYLKQKQMYDNYGNTYKSRESEN